MAEEVLVDDCMQARGKIYVPVAPPAADWGVDIDPRHDGNLDDARTWAFGLLRHPVPDKDANQAYLTRLSEEEQRAWDAALTGTPAAKVTVKLPNGDAPYMFSDGCVAKAKIILYGSVEAYLRTDFGAQEAEQRLVRSALDSATYRRAARRWSTCMEKYKYHYSTPQKMVAALAARQHLKFHDEQRAALASVRCAQSVRLGQRATDAYEEQRSRQPRPAAALRAWDELQIAADEKAEWVLTQAGIRS